MEYHTYSRQELKSITNLALSLSEYIGCMQKRLPHKFFAQQEYW